MIRVTYFIVCLLLGITLVSCIRDEALNAEADILTCTVSGDILKRDPIIENNKVVLMVTADADLTHQAPGIYIDSRCNHFSGQWDRT